VSPLNTVPPTQRKWSARWRLRAALIAVVLVAIVLIVVGPRLTKRPSTTDGTTDGSSVPIPPGFVGELRCLTVEGGTPTCAVFSTTSGRALVGSADGGVSVWNLRSGSRVWSNTEHPAAVQVVAVSPDGSRMISGTGDGELRVWDAESGNVMEMHKLTEPGGFASAAVSSNGRRLLAHCVAGPVYCWDLVEGRLLHRLDAGARLSVAAWFSPDNTPVVLQCGCRTLFGSMKKETKPVREVVDSEPAALCDVLTGQRLKSLGKVRCVGRSAILADGERMLVWDDQDARLLDAVTGTELWSRSTPWPPAWHGALSAGGRRLIVWPPEGDGAFVLWDLTTGREMRRFAGHQSVVTAVGFSRDGRLALSTGTDGTLRLWSLPDD